MILRLVKMEFKSEDTVNFLAYFETIKEKIEAMPGIVSLKLYQQQDNPNVIFTHSLWLSDEHLNNYRKSDVFGQIWPKTKQYFACDAVAWSLTLK